VKKFIEGFKKFFFPKFQFGKSFISDADIRKAVLRKANELPGN
jgi:hypothetical protein